jgi:rhodanese-related sulfurtransferase
MVLRSIARLAPDELRARRARGEALLPLDVRTTDARSVHPYEIPGSRWLPLAQVAELADELPRDVAIVAYCT